MAKEKLKEDLSNNEISNSSVPNKSKRRGKLLVSGSNFWSFEENPEFTGYYLGTRITDPRSTDEERGIEHDRVLGYGFVDEEGEEWNIGASYSIRKALEMINPDTGKPYIQVNTLVLITWKGLKELKGGKSVNQYDVELL